MDNGHDTVSRDPRVDAVSQAGFSLPVGTVTFLLTDVEGSTLAWQANGPAMGPAIARHYEILDAAVSAHGGVRPQEQGEGDSIVAAFGRASDALMAAIDAQRALAAEPWSDALAGPIRVRMAIHTGEAQMRNEANYVGQAIIRTARLRAIAHGGQVLVSQASRDLAVDQWGGHVELIDLGTHRLKDLARPEHVWQLTASGLEREFPPLASLDSMPNNLPIELSSFIGRQAEIAAVTALARGNRLVTVTGSGGAGKTRLAQQVAAQLADRFPDGTWWNELAPLDPAAVLAAVASVLSITEPDKLADRLGSRSVLLVLDNCEHVLDIVAPLAHALVVRCPNVHVLATSRGPLDVPGEVTWRVPPLSLPVAGDTVPIERLAQFDAVRLFIERARRSRPNFELTNENGPAVAELCARLDAIPLAIELAAARTKSLTPQQILAGLEDSLRLLTGGSRAVLPRQQTLEASIEWSHNLLGDKERVLLRRLSVFAGGCDLAAAEMVCSDADVLTEIEVLDALERVIDQALVEVDDTGTSARYLVLETVRQFAARHLSHAGETAAVAGRHTDWYQRLAADVGPLAEGSQERVCIDRLLPEHPNLIAALVRLRDAGDTESLGAMVVALNVFWACTGQLVIGSQWSTTAIELTDAATSPMRCRLLYVQSKFVGLSGRLEAMGQAQAAVAMGDEIGDRATAGRARAIVAAIASYRDPGAGTVVNEMAIADAKASNDLYGEAMAVVNAVAPHMQAGDLVAARQALQRSEEVLDRLGNGTMRKVWSVNLAQTCLRSGDLEGARAAIGLATQRTLTGSPVQHALQAEFDLAVQAHRGELGPSMDALREQLVRLERTNFQQWAIQQRGLIVRALHIRARFDEIRPFADESITVAGPMLAGQIAFAQLVAAQAALALGDPVDARRRLDSMTALLGPRSNRQLVAESHTTTALVMRAEGNLAGAEREVHAALAIAVEQTMLVEIILCFELLAGIAAANGSWFEAARLAGVAEQLRDDRGLGLRLEPHRSQHEQDLAAARRAIGDQVFETGLLEGRGLSLDQAVAFARRTRGERGRPTIGWLALTPTERRVADLARAALSNAAIGAELLMGAETVKTHLSRIYAKVGVANRTQLAAFIPPADPT